MRAPRDTTAALDESPLPVRAQLVAAWTSFMFLYVYVDVIGFYVPGKIDDILAGLVVASVQVPYAMVNAVGESWTYYYRGAVVLEVVLLAVVLRLAWTWPRRDA